MRRFILNKRPSPTPQRATRYSEEPGVGWDRVFIIVYLCMHVCVCVWGGGAGGGVSLGRWWSLGGWACACPGFITLKYSTLTSHWKPLKQYLIHPSSSRYYQFCCDSRPPGQLACKNGQFQTHIKFYHTKHYWRWEIKNKCMHVTLSV